ncbi:uncharacterized protein LOC126775781 [Nymphalis io]|uniref:uncharacterized protein LOC126775781 n=1 Tax=Inachis io TaxID=171585 RepID=UPI002166F194|nr:uncharacterized protein LOC126775781 [Nymphalis io]
MDIESVEKLIEIVRRHAFLFDMDHEQYKNASLKLATWETIGRELNHSGEVVRNKWKTIRDGYTKYKKQLKKSTGSSKKNVTYTWASQLSFLDNFNEPRPSCSNVLLKAIKRSPRSQTPSLDSDHSQDIPPTSSSSQALPPESSATTSTASTARISSLKNKRSLENDDDETESQFLNAKKKKELDVIDNLFLSYADTFKKFPAREQAVVKLELAKLFANTELQLLNNGVTFKSERSATD